MSNDRKFTQILDKLGEQNNILLAHSTILNQHTSILAKHTEKLDKHNQKFDEQAKILARLEKASDEYTAKLQKHDELFSRMIGEFFRMNQKIEEIDERTKYIPKMYGTLDRLAVWKTNLV